MADSGGVTTACLDLMRRLPPKDIEKNLAGLLNLVPESTDELLQRIDQVCALQFVGGRGSRHGEQLLQAAT